MEDGIDHRLVVVTLEGKLAGEQLVENDPQRPDVRAPVEPFSRACSGDMQATVPGVVKLFKSA
jgi:hypothetical protein